MKKQNLYKVMKERQHERFNNFDGIFYAFSEEQFAEGMQKFGLTDKKQVVNLGAGCYVLRNRLPELQALSELCRNELQGAIAEDKTGKGFIYDMFRYEMIQHEYGYTGEIEDVLEALDISLFEIKNSVPLSRGLGLAIENIMKNTIDWL